MKKADDVFHVGVGVRHPELPHTGSESVKRYNHFTKSVTGSCKSEHVPVLGPTVPLLHVSQEEWKRVSAQGLVHKALCTKLVDSFVYTQHPNVHRQVKGYINGSISCRETPRNH